MYPSFLYRCILGAFILLSCNPLQAQLIIFSENFGTGTTLPDGWSSPGTPSWQVFSSGSSSGYSNASGASQARTNGAGTHSLVFNNNMSTVGYTNLSVLWGGRRTSSQTSPISCAWSTDGTNWNSLSFSDVNNDGVWALCNAGTRISLPSTCENQNNLQFKWEILTSSGTYRIDDFSIEGTAVSCAQPSIQVKSLSFISVTPNQMTLNWTRGNGNKVFILGKSSDPVDQNPVNGNSYAVSSIFGNGQQIGVGNYGLYNFTGTSTTITGLNPGSKYYYSLFEYNTAENCYNVNSLSGSAFTLSSEPNMQVNSFNASAVQATQLTLNFSAPNSITNCTGYLILLKKNGNPNATPQDANAYSVGTIIGDAEVAAIITNSNQTSILLSGLEPSSNYNFTIIPYGYNGLNNETYNYYTEVIRLLSNVNTLPQTLATDYFRVKQSGNWSNLSTWESAADNLNWINSNQIPSGLASRITISSSLTLTVDTNVTGSTITVNGMLTFDGSRSRTLELENVSISSSGSFMTQASGSFNNNLNVSGNIVNNGIFDMSRGGSTRTCIVTFIKDGNQSISGSGSTTRFYKIGLNMGASVNNTLEIISSNFSASANFLHLSAGSANLLQNGTLKFSGTYSYTGALFLGGSNYKIMQNSGIWLNNPNVTITGVNDSYDLYGMMKLSDGRWNVGTSVGNSIKYYTGAQLIIEGGSIFVSGRLSPSSSGQSLIYQQTGGSITVMTVQSGTSSSARSAFEITSTSSYTVTGGSIVIQHGQQYFGGYDYFNYASTSNVSGGTLQLSNANATGVATFYLNSAVPLNNLTIHSSNAPLVYLFNHLNIQGDLSIGANTSLDVKNDLAASTYGTPYPASPISYNLILGGNWINSGSFLRSDKKVLFNGNASQSISGTSSNYFYDLEIDNSSGLVVNTNSSIDNALYFTSGIISTSTSSKITFDEDAIPAHVNNTSHIKGPTCKNSNNSNKFIFPVGDGDRYRAIAISPSNNSPTTWTAEYMRETPSDHLDVYDLHHISGIEYWNLDRPSGADATVELSWDEHSMADENFSDLVVAHYNGDKWESAGGNNHSGTASSGTLQSNVGWSSFSPFTLGSSSINNPLPVKLVSFTSQCLNSGVKLDWTTATEINNDYFTIEKSIDGKSFEKIAQINGSGNSTSFNYYSFQDVATGPLAYYRLSQSDYDGKSETFDLLKSDCITTAALDFYPSGAESNNNLLLIVYSPINNSFHLQITDHLGKIVHQQQNLQVSENRTQVEIDFGQHSRGLYFITLYDSYQKTTKKLMW